MGEFVAVHVYADVAQVQRDAVDDVRDAIRGLRVDLQLGGARVDEKAERTTIGAEVEGADRRRVDRDQGERRAVVGAGEVDLAFARR